MVRRRKIRRRIVPRIGRYILQISVIDLRIRIKMYKALITINKRFSSSFFVYEIALSDGIIVPRDFIDK